MVFISMDAEINHRLEMVHTVSGYTARLAIHYHRYIQTRQMSQDMDNFIFMIMLS
jgi:hypothetical protein